MKLPVAIIILLLFSLIMVSEGQTDSIQFSKKSGFIQHLDSLQLYNDLLLLNDIYAITTTNEDEQDSLRYYTGKAAYHLGRYSTSSCLLDPVAPGSPFHRKSLLMGFSSCIRRGDYTRATNFLNKMQGDHDGCSNIECSLSRYGLALLMRDYKVFDSLSGTFNTSNTGYAYLMEDYRLLSIQLKEHKRKRPWLAGVLSAIIPGLGKAYAGKPMHGISSFLAVATFGIQAWEGYSQRQLKSPTFYIFGGLAASFYIANIWGSVLTVKIAEDEFNHIMDQKIMLSIHIPVKAALR